MHMPQPPPSSLVLASGSATRASLLRGAGLDLSVDVPRIDEAAVRSALLAGGATPRDIADALAEAKARKVAVRHPDAMVIGADQVLALDNEVFGKAETPDEARDHLRRLRGRSHQLFSAAVIHEGGRPVWRHVTVVRLTVRVLSDDFVDDYVARNWLDIRDSVGGYRIEAEGVRLFERIEGDHFTILGLPLVHLLNYLVVRGVLST
jgi:septum formation protein